MGTAIKHHVPNWVKPSFVIFDIRTLRRSALSVRVPGCQKITTDGLTRSGTGCFVPAAFVFWRQFERQGTLKMRDRKMQDQLARWKRLEMRETTVYDTPRTRY